MKLSRLLFCAAALSVSVVHASEVSDAVPDGAQAAVAPEVRAAEPVAVAITAVEIGKPAPGKGQIIFFRPPRMTGALYGFKVREAGQELGVLENGNYFVLDVTPGRHEYEVRAETKDVTPVEVDEGEVYYLAGSMRMGLIAGRPNLSPSDAAAFEAVRGKLSQSSL